MRALLVPDDEAVRTALVDAGCDEVVSAPTIDAGLAALRERGAIDLVVIDIASPQRPLSAIATIARRARGVPVIALAPDELLAAALAARATDAIAKPLRPGELRVRLAAAVARRAEARTRAIRDRRISASIAKLQRENHELERLACVDALTGIANRRHVLGLLAAECARAARERAPVSLVMIDVDFFHAFNERYGHVAGDACLQRIVEVMAACLRRPADVLGRYGGEELVAILPATDASGARIVAERMRAAVQGIAIEHAASACAQVVTISAGFAAGSGRGEHAARDLVAAADAALLRAKLVGRNRIAGEGPTARPSHTSPHPWARFAPVIADPWFADRIPGFLATARDELAHVIAGALDGAALAGRRLETRARAFGFDQLRRLACELEHAARAGDDPGTRELATEIVDYVDHVQVVYRRPVEEITS